MLMIVQFSSVGALSEKWLNEFKQSISAHPTSHATEEKKGKKKQISANNEDMQLIWPTVDYVKASAAICCLDPIL